MFNKKDNKWSHALTMKNLKDLVIICLIGVITWKLLNANFDISIKDVSFSDLLSIVVSFFAIALSVAFYFKATDTSNKFYDNSYSFTKDIAEILGRMESGFGEKLKHLNEGYSGIRNKVDSLPYDLTSAKESFKSELEEIAKTKKAQEDIITSLMERANLAESEKKTVLKSISEKDDELEKAHIRINEAEKTIFENTFKGSKSDFTRGLLVNIAKKIEGSLPSRVNYQHVAEVRKAFDDIYPSLRSDITIPLENCKFIDQAGNLTNLGELNLIKVISLRQNLRGF